jgi:hypothetical protein
LAVVVGQFALPFVLLLSRELKRRPAVMASLGWLLIAMHVLDVYWLLLPSLHPAGVSPNWLDAGTLLIVGGFATASAAWRARGGPPVPIADPYFATAMRYVEP